MYSGMICATTSLPKEVWSIAKELVSKASVVCELQRWYIVGMQKWKSIRRL